MAESNSWRYHGLPSARGMEERRQRLDFVCSHDHDMNSKKVTILRSVVQNTCNKSKLVTTEVVCGSTALAWLSKCVVLFLHSHRVSCCGIHQCAHQARSLSPHSFLDRAQGCTASRVWWFRKDVENGLHFEGKYGLYFSCDRCAQWGPMRTGGVCQAPTVTWVGSHSMTAAVDEA